MPACPARRAAARGPRRPSPLDVEHLRGALEVWEPTLADEPGNFVLRVCDAGPTSVDLGALPIDGHPLSVLLGFDAPPDWLAVGAAGRGRAWALDADDDTGGGPEPVGFLHLVARSGAWASRWTVGPGGAISAGDLDGDGTGPPPPLGLVDDACRRAFGLPTAPPESTVVAALAGAWLDAVLDLVVGATAPAPTWADIAAQHPAAAIAPDPRLLVDGAGLATAAHDVAAVCSWTGVRAAATSGRWPPPGLDPELAAWFDDGSFARWLCTWPASLESMAVTATAVLPPALATQLNVALAAWGLVP